ncbi:MAG: CusA/CzcA family heavy metal efflux RND transporter [Gemmatimonadota bacterium]|jgi:cobalt-zinc-cadmium resistance protein CzcA|nr:CusA/CzcA family heavy metal efflux RND transporter [Gemmatimonadota bacterium]MDQ8147011.1 CusA/CzcA family heavy metal efflux RND transporter [Gemmatimonadota bacterium]MDQ8148734.1 CusA/CzcA family heavy metal efflux RND transporter [Gemmatimonadota bacterium]MDQ8156142.1 CusA/CzcA family heavy metal efflux RND transporter [Gemmatimonadota bacterium]MDQ8176426.1 CusA/CzcA family heavy metal efflux RND transporter [Gemmatimonadota bacterium]
MRRLLAFSLRQRAFVIGGVLSLVVAGLYALTHIPFDAFPDLTGTRVEVITPAPGMPPEDIERLVTYPIESALMGIPGAEGVRSVSKQGLSLVMVAFPDNVDIYFARTLVQQRLADAKGALPAGIEAGLGPVTTPMGELYQYTVTSDSLTLTELKTLHDYTIRPRLRSVPGVSEVNSWGGFVEQIHVQIDPAKLAVRDLTLADVHDALEANNRTFGGAYVETAGERFTIRGVGRAETRDEIARMVVAQRGGAPVLVRDVATVVTGALPRFGVVTQDGTGEVVTGMVLKLNGADSRRVIDAVAAKLEEVRANLPAHVRITPFYDQTQLVRRTTQTIAKNLIEGGLLVIAVLFLFLRNVRASLIVASVIPLSMLIAFGGMAVFGYSANLMSLGALDFGLIVDASVVMVENFVRRLERQQAGDRDQLFLDAAVEVGRPILFGIAIIVAVYIPLFALDGMEGRMFKPMAFTVVTAVLGSLFLALTYVPTVSHLLLRHAHEQPNRFFDRLRDAYGRGLDWVFAHARPVVTGAVALVVAALASFAWIGTEFMPKLDEGNILITTRRLPSISLEEATRLSSAVERILTRFPEVITVVTKEGRPDLATEAMGLFEGDTYVILKPQAEWTTATDRDGLVAAFDSALAVVPGLETSFTQPLAMRLDEAESGIRTDLGIKVIGPDLVQNEALGERIRSIVAGVSGAADVAVEIAEGSGQYRVEIDRAALARHGVSVADVQDVLDLATGMRAATELVDGPRRIGVAVRLTPAAAADLEALRRLTVRTATGGLVPVGSLARLTPVMGPELIAHEDAQRRTLVMANVRGRDLGSFVAEVRAKVAAGVRLPSGVFLEWGGQYENQQRALGRLGIVVPAALLLIYLLLFLSFGSVTQAGLVLLNVPFALVGGVAALWLRGLNLNLSASIGFIALFGIAVLNGVVLVEHLNHLRDDGRDLDDAVREGALDRLRPVLMTALVASLGFVPMALSHSAGSEVQRPLATVVIGGLLTSTVLTLFVLPMAYRALTRWESAREARAQAADAAREAAWEAGR